MSRFFPPAVKGSPGTALEVEPIDRGLRDLARLLDGNLDPTNLAPATKLSTGSADGAVPNAVDLTHHLAFVSGGAVTGALTIPITVRQGGPFTLVAVCIGAAWNVEANGNPTLPANVAVTVNGSTWASAIGEGRGDAVIVTPATPTTPAVIARAWQYRLTGASLAIVTPAIVQATFTSGLEYPASMVAVLRGPVVGG